MLAQPDEPKLLITWGEGQH